LELGLEETSVKAYENENKIADKGIDIRTYIRTRLWYTIRDDVEVDTRGQVSSQINWRVCYPVWRRLR